MTIRVGINGFGRIGRNFFRAAKQRGADIDFVAANDLGSKELMAHLLQYDTVLGTWHEDIEVTDGGIKVGGDEIKILAEHDPKALPWGDLGVDMVIESTGIFSSKEQASMHIDAGAPFVIVSAPSAGADATFVVGVNDDTFDPENHKVVSNASCTTNCFVPMIKVLDDAFGVERGLMTTVHAYTGTQSLVDGPSKDLREARAAALNIIPSSTGAARATSLVLESMKGKLDGTSLRVPVADGSITDFTGVLGKDVTVEEVNAAFRAAAEDGPLSKVLVYNEAPIVSSDIVGTPASCTFDAPITMANGNLVKVMGWYDNEWGYSNRLVDLIEITGAKLKGWAAMPAFGVPTLEDLPPVAGKRVLLRADFNVPIKDGVIADDLRIRAALPTIEWLLGQGASVTACTHLGRPKGEPDPKYSVEPVRRRLAELAPGVELLENLRFDPGETADDPAFVARLIEGFDAYVNDAFGASHRSHASIVGPPRTLPSAAGRLLAREVEVLLGVREKPPRPFVAIVGGSKVSDKLGVIDALLDIADHLVIGGGMCFTFLAAQGGSPGASLFESDQVETCRKLLAEHGDRIHLPSDVTALGPGGRLFEPDAGGEVRQLGTSIPDGWMGVDIGPGTAAEFGDIIAEARCVLWNGPMGVFEDPRFEAGTRFVAEAVADCGGFTVIGGGDSAAAAAQFGVADRIDHISTGGGASLELLEQGDLPGLGALRGAPNA